MTVIETITFISLYLLIGGVTLFVALIALPAAIRAVRNAWVHKSVTNDVMAEQYNITYQAVKSQYSTKTAANDVYADDMSNY